MKNRKQEKRISIFFLLAAIGLIAVILASCGVNTSNQQTTNQNNTTTTTTEKKILTADDKELSLVGYGAKGARDDENLTVADMLHYAIQDEYLARGEYIAIMAKFGENNPYANIKKSEETHIAYLTELFNTYGMELPADDSKSHIVVPVSLLEAAKVGVQAEIDNIAMYEYFLGQSLPQDVLEVFTLLKNASESHLAAFQKQVEKLS